MEASDMGILGKHDAAPYGQSIRLGSDELPGKLLRIIPHEDNEGIAGGANLLKSIYDVQKGGFRNRKNISDTHTFEILFDKQVEFYMNAATEKAADKFRRRVGSSYGNSRIFPVDGLGFPWISPEDYVAYSEMTYNREGSHAEYFPIRHFKDDDGFERDPYTEVLSEMLSTDDSKVMVQVAFRPVPLDWTEGSSRRDQDINDVAEGLRKGRVKGWWDPRIQEATHKDRQAAKIVENQRKSSAFATEIRVLAISPDKEEAITRARGVSGMFSTYYNSVTQQGLEEVHLRARRKHKLQNRLYSRVEKMVNREMGDGPLILTTEELAGVAHIPNKSIGVSKIEWKTTQSGDKIPADLERGI